ncbi:hypothetical protein [Agrobacterium pusense]|uniref:hypothetical protein n=1 Tax=Agrobacterium pusense TaxID=648995 RepID=UPI003FD3FD9A
MARKPVAHRIEELEARKRSLMARLRLRNAGLRCGVKMLPGKGVTSELRKAIAEQDVQMLRDVLRRHLSDIALRDDDRNSLRSSQRENHG